jgi:hypothetical protein
MEVQEVGKNAMANRFLHHLSTGSKNRRRSEQFLKALWISFHQQPVDICMGLGSRLLIADTELANDIPGGRRTTESSS